MFYFLRFVLKKVSCARFDLICFNLSNILEIRLHGDPVLKYKQTFKNVFPCSTSQIMIQAEARGSCPCNTAPAVNHRCVCMRSYKMWDVTESSQRPSIKLMYTEAVNFTQIGHQHGKITTVKWNTTEMNKYYH